MHAILAVVTMLAAGARAQSETHANLQAVNENGVSTWTGSYPFTLRGVLLNNPEEMLDTAWDPGAESGSRRGAQWQVFIQAVAGGDRGGTALWMGQNYNSLGPWIPAGNAYTESAWSDEMARVNYETGTLHHFRKGDLVEVTARKSLFFGGKQNINESHRIASANDFSVTLLQAGHGLPDPEVIHLSDLVNPDDGNPETREEIFDQTRQTGGEHYQGMRVRIEAIRIADRDHGSNGWGKTEWGERLCTVTDGEQRFFTLRMPLTDLGPAPKDWFSAIGILHQESESGTDGTFGYELFVQEIGPTLKTAQGDGRRLIYWSGTYTNYVLEYSTDLTDPSGWQTVTSPPVKWIAVEEDPATAGEPKRFYRLRQQD
ncbi:MAG: hypothetical protein KBA51_04435 [Kiritimatiellae bacterium]|nr:hypothetical protein [Kiritimatiellia bacterium]